MTTTNLPIGQDGKSALADGAPGYSTASLMEFPTRFYGRIADLKHLDNIRFRVLEQQTELALVRGISGVGKTSLVKEFIKEIPAGQFLVLSGKFDQYNRTVPYSGLVHALQSLLVSILAGQEGDVAGWRQRLSLALGENASLFTQLIPELERLLGRQQPVANLAPEESHNRFSLLFQKVIQALCQAERPMLLFLDDLQWVDSSTLEILVRLLSFTYSGGLMIIGSYRDNEVGQGHVLRQFERQMRGAGRKVHEIYLESLSTATIQHLLSDSFGCQPEKAVPLAGLVKERTGGNPFFIRQFLAVIRQDGLLDYDEQDGQWHWDLDGIKNQVPAHTVDELLQGLLASCSERSRELVGLASYLGNTFSLDLLVRAADEAVDLVEKELAPLVHLRLLLVEACQDKVEKGRGTYYRFCHDRVQQAAYALIPEQERLALHLSLGRRLLPLVGGEEGNEILFQVADQFRQASALIDAPAERLASCRLLMEAGHKAYEAASYQLTCDYLRSAISLLPAKHWHDFYDLALELHYILAEAAYLLRDFPAMEESLQQIMAHGVNVLDQSRVFELRAQACIVRSEMREAIDVILAGLADLGVQLNPQPGALQTIRALMTMRTALFSGAAVGAVRQPAMTDPVLLIVMRLLSKLLSAAYMNRPALLPVAVAELVRLSRRHGTAPESTAAYGAAGIIFCGVVGDINTGCRAGEVSLELLERHQFKAMMSQVYFYHTAFMAHWKEPICALAETMGQAYNHGVACGDFEYAAFGCFMSSYFHLFSGEQLVKSRERMADNSKALHELQQSAPLQMHEIYRQVVENLLAQGGDPWQLSGKVLDEGIVFKESAEDRSSLCHLHFAKLMMAYWFGKYDLALDQAEKTEGFLDSLTATYNVPLFHFYQALTLLALGPKKAERGTWQWRRRVKRSRRKLRSWAKHCPQNYANKYYLVEAEWQRLQGREREAARFFDLAIDQAALHGLIQEEGLAHEVAARFYLGQGKRRLARTYVQDAFVRIRRWGAERKLLDLQRRFSSCGLGQDSALSGGLAGGFIPVGAGGPELTSLVESLQEISAELDYQVLIKKLMRVLRQCSQATRIILATRKKGLLRVEAECRQDEDEVRMLAAVPGQQFKAWAMSVVNSVLASGQEVMVDAGSKDEAFGNDPYIVEQQPGAILCLPILNQGSLMALFYLENNRSAGSFSTPQLPLLRLLAAQIGVSLENAHFFADIKELNRGLVQEIEQRKDVEKQLYSHQEHLEETVRERTRRLTTINSALELEILERQKAERHLKETQGQLVHSEKMVALGQLVAGVAHEMNNAMNFISGALPTMTRIFADIKAKVGTGDDGGIGRDLADDFDDVDSLLQNIGEGAGRSRNIVNDLMMFARTGMDEPERVDVHQGINSTLALLQLQTADSVKVVKEFTTQTAEITCYPGQLNQVFMNILMNALHAMGNEGKIVVRTWWEDDDLLVSIKDNGPGIADELVDRIFDPFFTTKPEGKGTGLGLSISYGIVKNHGGTIAVARGSEPGAEFIIRLPRQMAAAGGMGKD